MFKLVILVLVLAMASVISWLITGNNGMLVWAGSNLVSFVAFSIVFSLGAIVIYEIVMRSTGRYIESLKDKVREPVSNFQRKLVEAQTKKDERQVRKGNKAKKD